MNKWRYNDYIFGEVERSSRLKKTPIILFHHNFHLVSQSTAKQSGSEEKGLRYQVGLAFISGFINNQLYDAEK